MKELMMYSKIRELHQKGFSISKISRYLGISRQTVRKYQKMSLDDYIKQAETIKKLSSLSEYESVIIDWLFAFPDMTAAQVYDWLLEQYEVSVSERTVSRYVKQLREDHMLPKTATPREYEAVDELPMGHQMQLDFGSKNMPFANKSGHKKVHFLGIVLSHSRYKWGYFQDRPFTSVDLVRAMDGCFAYFGGTANEIVIDQDSILTVSENYGDIIYTYEFEKYKKQHNLNIRVCRKADPESKGQVERVVQ